MLSKERLGEIRERCAVTAQGYEQLDVALADCKNLLSEIERLRSALEWYADEENYNNYKERVGLGPMRYTNEAVIDNGARARSALGEK